MTVHQIDDHRVDTDSWQPIRFSDAPDAPPLQPTLGGTQLLYPGKRHVFSGPPESAKTLAAYAILILIARNNRVGILIDFEMGASDAKTRLRELGATDHDLTRILYVGPTEPATPQRIAGLIAYQPELVVVDAAVGAYQLEGLDDNKRSDVEKISRLYVNLFWQNEIASLLIDHVVKNTETRGRFVIGSERKLGGSDVHLGFDTITPVSRGTNGKYKITTHKDRVGALKRGHLADLHLESDPETHQIAWTFTAAAKDTADAGYFRPTGLMEKASIYLEAQSEPVTRNTVADALGGTKEYVLKALTALVTEGFAAAEDGPRRARLVRSIRPYRENDPKCQPENGSTMRAEPVRLCSNQTTHGEIDSLAQPSSGSLVRTGSGLVRRTTDSDWFDGSSPYGDVPLVPQSDDTPEQLGWFDTNGELDEGYDHYLESIIPEELE